MCSFYYSMKALYSFTHNLFLKKIGMQVTHVRVFRVNLRPALRFKWTSRKSMRKSLKILQLPHTFPCVCVCTHSVVQASQPTQILSLPFPSENHWLETEMGHENSYMNTPWKGLNLALEPSVGNGMQHLHSVETLNIEVFVLGGC